MNKCRNCGKEFEGKFCPECGVQVKLVVFDDFETEFNEEVIKTDKDVAEKVPADTVEMAIENQTVNLKSLSKKKLFEFHFISKISGQFLSFLVSAILLFCGTVYTLCIKSSRGVFVMNSDNTEEIITAIPFIIVAAVLGVGCIVLTAFCILMLINKRPILNYPEMTTRRKEYNRFLRIIVVSVLFEAVFIGSYIGDNMGGFLFLAIIFPFIVAAYTVLPAIGLKFIKKIEKEYITVYDDGKTFNELTPLVNESIDEFRNINLMRENKCNARRAALGKVPKTAREVEKQYLFKKIAIAAGAVILASVIFVLSVTVTRNIFKVGYIEKISVGDSRGYVTRVLGEPYDKREIKDSQDKVTSCTYYYCSSSIAKDIAKINKKLEKFEDAEDFDDLEEMIELSEKLANLEEKLSKISCDYIEVSFENNKVNSVCLQKNCFYGDNLNSEVTKITYADANGKKYYKYGNTITAEKGKEEITVNARLYFGDGSLLNKQIKVKLNSGQTGVQNLTWSDSFGTHEIIVNLI